MARMPIIMIYRTLNDAETGVHVAYDRREHDTDGLDCWCGPWIFRVCDDCEDGCWKCTNGKTRITAEEAEHEEAPLLIVHQGMDFVTR